jgi:hypothetical protein
VVAAKTKVAVDAGLKVIACVGEKLEHREAGQTEKVRGMGLVGFGLNSNPVGARVGRALDPLLMLTGLALFLQMVLAQLGAIAGKLAVQDWAKVYLYLCLCG